MNNPVLSILIINFNGRDFLENCILSISKNISYPYEIIVVDNASIDGSAEFINSNHPEVILIKSEVNTGFSGGNNIAAKFASGQYILLLNNDTVIQSSIDPLIEILNNNSSLGVLGGRLFYSNKKQQESIGYEINIFNLIMSWTPFSAIFRNSRAFRRTVHSESSMYNDSLVMADWVSGAFLMIRHDLWTAISGFDESYFMYMEDTDLCRRAIQAGFSVGYSSNCQILHFEGAGRRWLGERAILNSTNSYLLYSKKFYGSFGSLLLRVFLTPIFLLRALSHGVFGLLRRDPDGYSKSTAYFNAAKCLIHANQIK